MKINTLFILLFCFVMTAAAQESPSIPNLPKTGTTLESFIPADWQLLKRADGDLNKDGLEDTIAVIEFTKNPDDAESAPPRLLFIIFKQGDSFQLSFQSAKAILRSDAGGMMGDPFQELKYSNGSFLISLAGGSRERWAYDLRFRFQDDGWYLIGFTNNIYDTITEKGQIEDYNLLTGQMLLTTISGNRQTPTKKQREKRPLVNLKDFDAELIEELQY